MARYHGLELAGDGTGYHHHGVLKLLERFYVAFLVGRNITDRPLKWEDEWFDGIFAGAFLKFSDTVWKFYSSANRFAISLDRLGRNRDPQEFDQLRDHLTALEDIQLFLDLMLFYFRIEADSLANMIPNLYGVEGRRQSIPRQSFRDQCRWFMRPRNAFDPQYAQILESDLKWFTVLSGDIQRQGGRLRDAVTHYRGIQTITYGMGENSKLKSYLWNEAGIMEPDLITTLKATVADYYEYLDSVFVHFLKRLQDAMGTVFDSPPEVASRWIQFDAPQPSHWIYPMSVGE